MKTSTLFQASLTTFIVTVGVVMLFFMCVVMFSMGYVLIYSGVNHYMSHKKSKAETWAFVFSGGALLFMGYPSMSLLYEYSTKTAINIIVKVVGAQWYWNFEVSNLMEEPVLMYMLPLEEMSVGESRFLEVENRLVIPTGILVQFNITSSDVIHSFSLPTMGAKVDATSGLLTVVPVITGKMGTHYGQCSEICGMNHSFMPFSLEVTTFYSFLYWVFSL